MGRNFLNPQRISDFEWVAKRGQNGLPDYGEADVKHRIENMRWERLSRIAFTATMRLYPKSLTAAVGLGTITYMVAKIPVSTLIAAYDFQKLFEMMADKVEHANQGNILYRMARLNDTLFSIAEKHHGDDPYFYEKLFGDYDEDWDY